MKRWLVSVSLALFAFAAHAVPTVADVEAQIRQGDYAQAQSMMHDVVAAKPGSARAHYVYAEILAHNARFADAAREAAQAKQLDPSLQFTTPEKFNAFQQSLEREVQRGSAGTGSGGALDKLGPSSSLAAPVRSVQPAAERSLGGGVPLWVWVVGLVVFVWLVRRLMRSARPASGTPAGMGAAPYAPGTGAAPNYGPGAPYGPGAAYGPGGVAPSAGSGLMGAGLAAAGGVAAGMLAERLLERGHESRGSDYAGGNSFGNSFGNASPPIDTDARDLENRNVDFGSGSDDWGSNAGDGGGSVDLGGSGGGDDGGW